MEKDLVKLFKCAVENKETNLDVKTVESMAIQRGYIVDPKVCNQAVVDFLEDEPVDYNSTFYTSWNDIISRNRLDLLLDQIVHYATTYGTNFSLGNGYVPRELEDTPVIPYNEYKVISCVSGEEMLLRCYELLNTDVALKSETVKVLVEYIYKYTTTKYKGKIDQAKIEEFIDTIKNREARTLLQDLFQVLPKDKFELLKYIIYKTTGESMIIQNKRMIEGIQNSVNPFDFSLLDEERMIALSSIFLRYKKLFLAFKHMSNSTTNSKYINRLRRLAIKNHKPMVHSIWDRITSDSSVTAEMVSQHLDEISNFRKLSLVQAIQYNINISGKGLDKTYIIRNGRCFTTPYNVELSDQEVSRLKDIVKVLIVSIVSHLSSKNLVVKYAEGVDITAPTSEKSFIGDYPIGTSYQLQDHNLIGIYWRNEWGAHDFDLSLICHDGQRIAWNSYYKHPRYNIFFSGDMTNADPEATEIIYADGECPDGVVRVNRFNGSEDSKFRLFFAQHDMVALPKNYMVDPNDIKFSADLVSEKSCQNIGVVHDNVFTLMNLQMNDLRVSSNEDKKDIEILKAKMDSFISLNSLLKASDSIDYNTLNPENEEDKKVLDAIEKGEVELLDLTNIQRDTLINLFK